MKTAQEIINLIAWKIGLIYPTIRGHMMAHPKESKTFSWFTTSYDQKSLKGSKSIVAS